MEIKQLQLGEHRLLGVEVPKDAKNLRIHRCFAGYSDADTLLLFELPNIASTQVDFINEDGNWQIIARASDVTKEQAKGLVETSTLHGSEGMKSQYRNYTFTADVKQFDTALESWNSFMRANNINPDTLILKEI